MSDSILIPGQPTITEFGVHAHDGKVEIYFVSDKGEIPQVAVDVSVAELVYQKIGEQIAIAKGQ